MNALWNLDIDTVLEWYDVLRDIQDYSKKVLTTEQTEVLFLEFMKLKNIKPSGNTELNKEELIKEITSHGKTILNIDEDGSTIIKPKDNDGKI
jgi:hypothetical protein